MKSYTKNGKKVVPYTLAWDNMPIDLSYLFEEERPAGKHGFLTVSGDRFVFEDGTPGRFWGVNFNSGANFPSHEHSEKVARRLAQTGVNLVRFHQMDAEWSTPNLFQFSRGKWLRDTQTLDPDSLDRLDYLIFCLKREGIYIYMDLLTYRRFKKEDGIACSDQMMDAAKPYVNFDRQLIELQKKFCRQLWTHHNPYTGLAYKDEPAIVLTEILNENDLFHPRLFKIIHEPYRSELEERYRRWADRQGIADSEDRIDFEEPDSSVLKFFRELTEQYYLEMIGYMRSIGVKIPITGTNWANTPNLLAVQLVTDFTDSHTYWAPNFGDQRKFSNRMMTAETQTFIDTLSISRTLDRPFFVSEWDEPWPYEWRAEAPLYLAAVGAFQGWGGFAIHTYRYGTNKTEAVTGKLGRDIVIGNSYYRGIFDTYNDPAKYGLFYHAALLFRRGDVKEGRQSVGMRFDSLDDRDIGMLSYTEMPALRLISERHRFGTVVPGCKEVQDITIGHDKPSVDQSFGEVISDTGELGRSFEKKYGWIDTASTKAVYGMTGAQGEIALTDVSITVENDFATVALSSLTSKPISCSENILLTAVGRADNAGSVYNEDHTTLLDSGRSPVECEVIRARISIRTNIQPVRIWSVDDEGYLTGVIPSDYEDGVLTFEIGNEHESIYYLIQKQ